MEKFSYNSYPDSAESSPRSRDVDFDNPPPWEDQTQQQTNSYKVKFMCSYGGKIQPRPHDNQLTYVNGDTKILSVDRGIRFPALASKLSAIVDGGDGEISFKYQLPGEDLDALISVTNEDDLEHMMHEYDRLLRMSTKPARMRLFLFPSSPPVSGGGFGSEGSTKSESTLPNRPESEKSVTAPASNADFLFGSEKVVVAPPPAAPPSPPRQIQDPQMFVNQQVITPDQAEIQRQINEFQRIQIRDQEHQQQQMQHQQQQHQLQQQEAMYRRKSEDGRYFTPTYAQNPPPQPPPPTTTVSQTNQLQPPAGYWQGNNNNMYTTTSQNLPEQQVYVIPAQSQAAPGTLYHSVMRPPPTQGSQQGYYPPVQRVQQHHPDPYMEQQNQQGYNVVQPPQPAYSGGPQVMSSGPMGLHETPPYSQMGNPVYYTVAGDGMMVPPQPHQTQYQGMGQPISGMTGPDGKVVVNTAPKVSQSSDSV